MLGELGTGWQIALFALVGLAAQTVDGALGMAYGVSCNALLLSLGLPPAIASASVHAAEVVTTGISGVSHASLGNVEKRLFLLLILPGMIGAALGACLLTSIDGSVIKPWVALYLLLLGCFILYRAIRNLQPGKSIFRRLIPLGALGGFCDAVGGGGWGPIVTSTLLAHGEQVHTTVGSVNAVEFFVSAAQTVIFVGLLWRDMLANWPVILGLLAGGAVAAPFAAMIVKKLEPRWVMGLVGALICVLNLRTLAQVFGAL